MTVASRTVLAKSCCKTTAKMTQKKQGTRTLRGESWRDGCGAATKKGETETRRTKEKYWQNEKSQREREREREREERSAKKKRSEKTAASATWLSSLLVYHSNVFNPWTRPQSTNCHGLGRQSVLGHCGSGDKFNSLLSVWTRPPTCLRWPQCPLQGKPGYVAHSLKHDELGRNLQTLNHQVCNGKSSTLLLLQSSETRHQAAGLRNLWAEARSVADSSGQVSRDGRHQGGHTHCISGAKAVWRC